MVYSVNKKKERKERIVENNNSWASLTLSPPTLSCKVTPANHGSFRLWPSEKDTLRRRKLSCLTYISIKEWVVFTVSMWKSSVAHSLSQQPTKAHRKPENGATWSGPWCDVDLSDSDRDREGNPRCVQLWGRVTDPRRCRLTRSCPLAWCWTEPQNTAAHSFIQHSLSAYSCECLHARDRIWNKSKWQEATRRSRSDGWTPHRWCRHSRGLSEDRQRARTGTLRSVASVDDRRGATQRL